MNAVDVDGFAFVSVTLALHDVLDEVAADGRVESPDLEKKNWFSLRLHMGKMVSCKVETHLC